MEPYSRVAVPRKLLPFSPNEKLPKKVILSYIADYLILLVLFIAFQALNAIEPFHQHFALQNYTLQYPYAVKERVPIWLAIIIAVACPALIIAVYTLAVDGLLSHHRSAGTARWKVYTLRQRLWELNCGILGLLLASGTAFVITNALKNATGKPRPDFIDRCQPAPGSVDAPVFGLSNSSICTQTDNSILKDGFKSFPSGHSSSSFAGLFYLTLYLSGKLHIWDTRGFVWKPFLVMIPTLAASLIAISRIEDARHHPFDVLSGSALGILCAWGSYRQYFPPLSEPWCKGRAYPIRTWGSPSDYGRGRRGSHKIRVDAGGGEHYGDQDTPMHSGTELRPLPYSAGSGGAGAGFTGSPGLAAAAAVAAASSSDGYHSGAEEGGEAGGANHFRQQVQNTERQRVAEWSADTGATTEGGAGTARRTAYHQPPASLLLSPEIPQQQQQQQQRKPLPFSSGGIPSVRVDVDGGTEIPPILAGGQRGSRDPHGWDHPSYGHGHGSGAEDEAGGISSADDDDDEERQFRRHLNPGGVTSAPAR